MGRHSGAYQLAASRKRSRLEAAADDTAPGCLRLHAKNMLAEWGMPDLAGTVELLVSELVTNSVQAPEKVKGTRWRAVPALERPCVELCLTPNWPALLIEVWDGYPAPPPRPSLPAADALGGRGLFLVETLSQRWGYYYPALPDSPGVHGFDRFRPARVPGPPELHRFTGKVVWCEVLPAPGIPAASLAALILRTA